MEAQAQERRPAPRPEPAAPVVVPEPLPEPELVAAEVPSPPPPPPPELAKPVKKAPAKVVAAKPPKAASEPVAKEAPVVLSVPLEPPPVAVVPTAHPVEHYRDGTYTGWGQSYHGDIEAKVVISGGRIVSAGVASCATRYPCDVIDTILYQPVERQSAEVDGVSRATESSDAYFYGLQEALKKALEAPADPASSSPP